MKMDASHPTRMDHPYPGRMPTLKPSPSGGKRPGMGPSQPSPQWWHQYEKAPTQRVGNSLHQRMKEK